MKQKRVWTVILALVPALAGVMVLMWLLGGPQAAFADPDTRYVAASGDDLLSDCTNSGSPCRTVQRAVDEADSGDVILVASGVYTDIHGRPLPPNYLAPPELDTIYQVVYVDKTISIRGGYTIAFTDPPDPDTNPTTLNAQGNGRVIVIAGEITATIEGLQVTGGDATGLYGEGGPRDAGGGVYSTDATVTISNNLVFSNTAYYGGGMYLRYSVVTLSENTIVSNTAYYGGGARLHRSDAVTVTNNTVKVNTADAGGGLVVDYCNDATLSGNTIITNTATNSMGGGLYLNVLSGTVSGNTIIANTATNQGGGVLLYASDNATLISNTIAANTAEDGGGARIYQSDAMLIGNTITANTAESGGGLELWYSDATLDGNIIIANTAIAGGGGGLSLGLSNAALINNIIADNQTMADTGSGLAMAGSSPQLLHNTIVRNGGDQGYGVVAFSYGEEATSVVMTNTILTDHKWGIYVSPGNTALLESTLWNNTYDLYGNGTVITGSHNYWGDPHFGADGYHLLNGSPAIDKGIEAGVTADIDGDLRPQGLAPDLGADESTSLSGEEKYIFLPIVLKPH